MLHLPSTVNGVPEKSHSQQNQLDDNASQMTMAVYLRIKPNNLTVITDEINESHYELRENSITVNQSTFKSYQVFDFKHIFRPIVSQDEVYRTVMKPRIFELFKGHDSLIFALGTSNSGKSYTIQGTPKEPGLIPRTLYSIFCEIDDKIDQNPNLQPYRSTAVYDSEQKAVKDSAAFFQKLIETKGPERTNPKSYKGINTSRSMGISDGLKYSVWISCLELYNDMIQDLLQTPTGKPLGPPVQEADGSVYIEDLVYVPVSTWHQALDVYMYAKSLVHVSATRLNQQSSRSHCIFGIKLIRWPEANPKTFNFVSNMWLCDLAGTERTKRTGNSGARLKESNLINGSLFVLNKCFDVIRANQHRSNNKRMLVPFRESKLTLLFKKFLLHPSSVTIITNISQDSSMVNETTHVLKIAAIATKTELRDAFANRRRITRLFNLPEPDQRRNDSGSVSNEEILSAEDLALAQQILEMENTLTTMEDERWRLKKKNKTLKIENVRLKMWKEIRLKREAEATEKKKATERQLKSIIEEEHEEIEEMEELIEKVEEKLASHFDIVNEVMGLDIVAFIACERYTMLCNMINVTKNYLEIDDESSDLVEICQLITERYREMKVLAREEITRLQEALLRMKSAIPKN